MQYISGLVPYTFKKTHKTPASQPCTLSADALQLVLNILMECTQLDVAISHVSNISHVCLPLKWFNFSNFALIALILKDRQKGFLCVQFFLFFMLQKNDASRLEKCCQLVCKKYPSMKYPLEVNILLCMDKALGEYSYQYIIHTHSFEKKMII